MKENYKNNIIYINHPVMLKEGGFQVRYQIENKMAFNLELKNTNMPEKAIERAITDAKKYIDENL